jgi:hypothetical protein
MTDQRLCGDPRADLCPLHAAAPELLAALETALRKLEEAHATEDIAAMQQIRAAIQLARGDGSVTRDTEGE